MLLGVILAVAIVVGILFYRRGSFNRSYSGAFGAVMTSSKTHRGLWMAAIVAILGLIIWYFWSSLVSLHNSLLGPDVPMWWYVVGIVGIIIIIGLFRLNKEGRDRTINVAEWLIGFAAIAGSLIIFSNWEKEDALCPDKQVVTSVPATGMVLDLESCWKEPFMVLDLRETGIPKLAFNDESAVLRGRMINDFAHIQTGLPGAIDGQGRIAFNREEMMRLGITRLSVFIAPADHQPGAIPRFSETALQALSQ